MRFLLSPFGSAGDVFPALGLALELRGRGHDVTLATNPHFEELVRGYGIPFEPLGTRADFETSVRDPNLWNPRRAFPHIFKFLQPCLQRQYELHAAEAGRDDFLGITSCFGMGALNAQEKLGVPVLTLHLQPAVIWSRFEPPTIPGVFGPRWLKNLLYGIGERMVIDRVVCPFLNGWRKELGLPPVRKVTRWWHSPRGVLCLFPEWFAPPQPDWPQPLMQTDFPLWNHRSNEPLDLGLDQFLDEGTPPLVFTPGSANVHGRKFFEAAVSACQSLGRRGLLLTQFAEQVPDNLPATIRHVSYAPLDRLLPRAAAFVHHGGVGSMSQAMLAGIPQVLMPLAHDQFDNAARVHRLGVGDAIPERHFTGKRLARTLMGLLDAPPVANFCRQAADRLTSRDGLSRAADLILHRSTLR